MKSWIRKLIPLLLVLVVFGRALPVMAEETETNGEAEFRFESTVYHVRFESAEVVDGELEVAISGFGSTLPFRNGGVVIVAWASVIIDGEEIDSYTVTASDGIYTYSFETDKLPDKVVLYPYEDSDNAVPLWEYTGDGYGTAPAPAAAAEVHEAPAAAVPEELVGTWHGTGYPKNGGTSIDLTARIEADGTGDYEFIQGSYTESYPFVISSENNEFSVDIPTGNYLNIGTCGGTWELDGEVLKLDITTTFASGGNYSYLAELTKTEAETEAPDAASDEVTDFTDTADNEAYSGLLSAFQNGLVLGLGSKGDIAEEFQQALIDFGEGIEADGIIGHATIKALNAIREECGIEASDEIDAEGFEKILDLLDQGIG